MRVVRRVAEKCELIEKEWNLKVAKKLLFSMALFTIMGVVALVQIVDALTTHFIVAILSPEAAKISARLPSAKLGIAIVALLLPLIYNFVFSYTLFALITV